MKLRVASSQGKALSQKLLTAPYHRITAGSIATVDVLSVMIQDVGHHREVEFCTSRIRIHAVDHAEGIAPPSAKVRLEGFMLPKNAPDCSFWNLIGVQVDTTDPDVTVVRRLQESRIDFVPSSGSGTMMMSA